MNDTRKRSLPASSMTQRTAVAKDILAAMVNDYRGEPKHQANWARAAVVLTDALFDELETPPELRDADDFDHEGTP